MNRRLLLLLQIAFIFGSLAHSPSKVSRSRRSTEGGCIPAVKNSTLEHLCDNQAAILDELFTDVQEMTYVDKKAPMEGAKNHLNNVPITFFYDWHKKVVTGFESYEKMIRPVLKDAHLLLNDNLITTNIPGKSIKGKLTAVVGNTRTDVAFEVFFRNEKIIRAIVASTKIMSISGRCTDDSKDFICQQQFFKIKDTVQGINKFQSAGEKSTLHKDLKNTKITVVEDGAADEYKGFEKFKVQFTKLIKKDGFQKMEFINEQQHQNTPGNFNIRMLVHTGKKNNKNRYIIPFVAEFKKGTDDLALLEVRLPAQKEL